MTLPTDITFPSSRDYLQGEISPQMEKYFSENTLALKDMYGQIARNLNGFIRVWTPTVSGSTTPGKGTYNVQEAWLRRTGIITEIWFDVGWTAHTGTGNVVVNLPYTSANATYEPWVGTVESVSASNTFSGGYTYLVLKVEAGTSNGLIKQCGSGVASLDFPLAGVGRFAGYVQYIGKEIER